MDLNASIEDVAGSIPRDEFPVLLQSSRSDTDQGRYSLIGAKPLLSFRSHGSGCEIEWHHAHDTSSSTANVKRTVFANPWRVLDELMTRFELLDEIDLPFPLGACIGYWGYDLKHFVEPKVKRRVVDDLELPECVVRFYPTLLILDHRLDQAWIVATGLRLDGSRHPSTQRDQRQYWKRLLASPLPKSTDPTPIARPRGVVSSIEQPNRERFLRMVSKAQCYIRQGDIYQVNLAHRLSASFEADSWHLYQEMARRSPAPFSAWLPDRNHALISSSPELFLRMSGHTITTRPIKGTRPRAKDSVRDSQLAYELQTSDKERAELVMITDLLRNDLGRISEYGSVQTPDMLRLERYAHVQHLVSTVIGTLRPEHNHLTALRVCFPGGSITGAPKIRAMEIIEELEGLSRGPYTGCIGYLGFNRESQLSIAIRTAIHLPHHVHFYAGAGIVADSDPTMEYEETLHKAAGFLESIGATLPPVSAPAPAPTPAST